MLHHYNMIDKGYNNFNWGVLEYDDKDSFVDITFSEDAKNHLVEAPPIMEPSLREGKRTLGPYWTKRMITGRIVPPERPNISDILRNLGMKEYDPIEIYIRTKGKTDYDMIELEQID